MVTIFDFTAHVICDTALLGNFISLNLKYKFINLHSSDNNPIVMWCHVMTTWSCCFDDNDRDIDKHFCYSDLGNFALVPSSVRSFSHEVDISFSVGVSHQSRQA